MIDALVVDDEDLARQRLCKLLSAFRDLTVVDEARDGEEAMQKISCYRPQVVFLDIEMPGAGGLEVARSLASPRPRIVFCTGYDQYAIQAFELHAVDYLLKPVTRERLERTIQRLPQTHETAWESDLDRITRQASAKASRFLARIGNKYRVIELDEVQYFASEDKISMVHTAEGSFWMEPSLNALEERLDPGMFFRISRASIVRLDRIFEVIPLVGGYGEVRLRNGICLPISRRRFHDLLVLLGQHAGFQFNTTPTNKSGT